MYRRFPIGRVADKGGWHRCQTRQVVALMTGGVPDSMARKPLARTKATAEHLTPSPLFSPWFSLFSFPFKFHWVKWESGPLEEKSGVWL